MTTSLVRTSARRIWGMMYRHLALYRRSWPRLLELAYWPVLQMCIWGFTASYLAARMGNPAAITGTGTAGTVPLWTGSTALGNSEILQSSGNVGIGRVSPNTKLVVENASGAGIVGSSSSTTTNTAIGVQGQELATTGKTTGVVGLVSSDAGTGVEGQASATSGATFGVVGDNSSNAGYGVAGNVSSTTGDTNAANNSSTATVTIGGGGTPDVSVVKSHTGNFTAGSNGTFTIAVSNVGTGATTGVITVTDTLNSNFTFVSGTAANWTCAAAAQVVTCTNPGPLNSGASAVSIPLIVSVSAAAPAPLLASAEIKGQFSPVYPARSRVHEKDPHEPPGDADAHYRSG